MQINGPTPYNPAQPLRGPVKPAHFHRLTVSRPAEGSDQLTLSSEVQSAAPNAASGQLRAQRVAEIRAELEAGTYESVEKLNVAVDRLLDRIG